MSSFQSLEEHISILSSFRSRGANGIEAGNGSQESESYVAIPLASSGSGGNSACQYSGGSGGGGGGGQTKQMIGWRGLHTSRAVQSSARGNEANYYEEAAARGLII